MRKMYSLLMLCFIIGVSKIQAIQQHSAGRPMVRYGGTAISLIEQDLSRKAISYERALLLKAYALWAPEKLPQRYQGTLAVRCGTPVIMEIKKSWKGLSRETKNELSFMFRPVKGKDIVALRLPVLDSTYTTEHFTFKYTLNGPDSVNSRDENGNNVPDYVEAYGRFFEYSRTYEYDTLQYPISFSPMPCIVYIVNRNYCGNTYLQGDTIRIEVENDFKLNAQGAPFETKYSPVSNQQVTAAHEFFHLIQFDAYGQRSYDWWLEATAGWMEDEVYDGLNVYTEHLSDDQGSIFKKPQYSLDDIANLDEFTCLIYPKLLAERNGRDIIQQIWQRITLEPDRYNAIQTVLGGEAAFKDFFKTFVAANYLKDESGGYIDDAAPSYPDINKVKTYFTANNQHYAKTPPPAVGQPVEWEEGMFSGNSSVTISLPHLASHYIRYMKPARVDTATTLYVRFEGQGASGIWGLMGGKTRGADKEKFEIPLDANNRVEDYAVTLEPNVSEVVFIPCNLDKEAGETPYRYSLCCVPVFRAAYSPNPANGTTNRVRNLDKDNKFAPGDTVRLLVSLSDSAHIGDRFTLTADFSGVDNSFDSSKVKVSLHNAGALEYQIK